MKLDRLIGILTILLKQEKATAPQLAERFEVSRRTILRDIDTLAMAGIPITAARGGGGGISIMEGYKINKNVLTSDELHTLVSALKGMDSVTRQSSFESLMNKLAPSDAVVSLSNSMVIDLSSHYKDSLSDKIALFQQAIAQQKCVRFAYFYPKGETVREIEPYFVEFRWNAWYVFGWCRLRKDFRRFKLNRLWEYTLMEDSFHPRPVPPEKASAEDAFPEQHHVTILFDKSVRFRLIEVYGLHCYEETEDGLLFSMDFTNKEYVYSWILGFGHQTKILEPEETRMEFAALAQKIYERYHQT